MIFGFRLIPILLLAICLIAPVNATDCCSQQRVGASTTLSADDVNQFLESIVPELMRDEKIPGVAFVLVQNGKVVLSRGFGYADVDQKHKVDPVKTIFPIGSVSKVFTATAVVQLADHGKIRLDADVNQYLRKLKIPENDSQQPIKVAHLLNHTSGLDEIRPGTQAKSQREILPLQEFLKPRIVRVHPPGMITSYSTYGITLAGLLVEEVSGMSYETYLNRSVWKPLGMTRTHISTPPSLESAVATPYVVEDDVVKKVAYEWYHTTPASSIRSTVENMGRFIVAHLQCGKFEDARIFSSKAGCQMHETQSTTHTRMPGWTYGFQEDDANGLRIVEHGGDIAGFSTLLVLLPQEKTGFFIAHHVEGANLRFAMKQKLLDRYYPDRRSVKIPIPVPDGAGKLKRFEGLYKANLFCHTCTDSMPVAEVEVKANPDGTITVWDDRWVQTSPLLFVRIDGKRKIGFQEDKSGRILQLSAGSWKVLEKVK